MTSGRHTEYTDEIGDRICELVATHPVGYGTLTQLYPDIPKESTVKEYRFRYPAFAAKYLQAKSMQAQVLVEEIDQLMPDEIGYYYDDKGHKRIDAPSASLLIAKVNNRKWTAARLAPRIYGDQKQIEELQSSNEQYRKELEELRAKLDAKNVKEY